MVEHEDGVLQGSVLALNLFDLFIQIAALLLELLLLLRSLFDKNTHGRESCDSVNKRLDFNELDFSGLVQMQRGGRRTPHLGDEVCL